MPSPHATKIPATFACDCGKMASSSCKGLPLYKVHEGKQYCVLHHPSKEKSATFRKALERKLEAEDFNFCGVWFPDAVDFSEFTFTKPANFTFTTFSAEATFKATFIKEAYFSSATFGAEANFSNSLFCAMASFYGATFSTEAHFIHTIFSARVAFNSATFTKAFFFYTMFGAEVDFDYATFGAEVNFLYAHLKDYVRFVGKPERPVFSDTSILSLQFARVEKPERISFHTLTLRPHWFVNVDARKFEFVNVNWNWRIIGVGVSTKKGIKSLLEKGVSSPHRLLAIACRNLALNAEENHRYHEASLFRYLAMDARRSEGWRSWRNLAYWTLHRAYWLASGYGERMRHAVSMLFGIWLFSALLYTQVGFVRWEPKVSSEREAAEAVRDEVGEPLRWRRALTYSLGVMTLQKPEPRPATNAAQALVMLETILGPVQAALLALAIRRKFMR